MPSPSPAEVSPEQIKQLGEFLSNIAINLVCFFVGIALSSIVFYLGRRLVVRTQWKQTPYFVFGVDALTVLSVTVVGGVFELWKLTTVLRVTPIGATGYLLAGICLSGAMFSKWLVSAAKDKSAEQIAALSRELSDAQATSAAKVRECERLAQCEALVSMVMREKLIRLIDRSRTGVSLEDALAPTSQIILLIQVTHKHFARYAKAENRLRIGIYQLGENNILEVIYSWDGDKQGCFDNGNGTHMDIASTPAGESVIVDCWRKKKEDPFIFVADFDADEEPYDYFYPAQNTLLRSMMAYHHRFTRRQGGFILTMDSTQAGLFSSDVSEECRVLLPAISRRIELEFSAATGNSPVQPQSNPQS